MSSTFVRTATMVLLLLSACSLPQRIEDPIVEVTPRVASAGGPVEQRTTATDQATVAQVTNDVAALRTYARWLAASTVAGFVAIAAIVWRVGYTRGNWIRKRRELVHLAGSSHSEEKAP